MPSPPAHETTPVAAPRAEVRSQLARLLRRARLVAFGRAALRATFYALLAAVGLAMLREGHGIPAIAAGAVAIGVAAAVVWSLARPLDPVALAKRLDDHADLQDRLSSAADLLDRGDGVTEAIIDDAARHAAGRSPGEVLPFRLPRETYFLAVPVVFLALAGPLLFPPPPPPPAAFTEAVDERAAALESFVDEERKAPEAPEREEALDRLRKLAEEMKKKPATKRSILASTGKVMAEMKTSKKKLIQKQRLESQSLLERMKKVALLKPIAEDVEGTRFDAAIEGLEEVLQDIEEKEVTQDDLGDVQKSELESLLKRLRSLGRNLEFVNKVLQFLEEIEGEIGELSDMVDPEDLEFWQNPERQPRRRPPERQPGDPQGPPNQTDWGRGTTENPFGDPKRTPTDESDPEGVTAKEGKRGKSAASTLKSPGEEAQSGLSYREKYAKYKQMAEDVLHREEIPLGYREYIKRYFDRIQPEEEE